MNFFEYNSQEISRYIMYYYLNIIKGRKSICNSLEEYLSTFNIYLKSVEYEKEGTIVFLKNEEAYVSIKVFNNRVLIIFDKETGIIKKLYRIVEQSTKEEDKISSKIVSTYNMIIENGKKITLEEIFKLLKETEGKDNLGINLDCIKESINKKNKYYSDIEKIYIDVVTYVSSLNSEYVDMVNQDFLITFNYKQYKKELTKTME